MDKEEELKRAKITDDADSIEEMMHTNGWNLLVEKVKERYKIYLERLITCNLDNLVSIQTRIDEMKTILDIPKNILKEKKILEEKESGE